ncbi:hypothetical protein FRX31_032908 [Thalictrum thalictroides]|uniref:Uncharacterized protein n=1 Tax=Thalictrum thalictroides TaxID=46969 RepID=A0A7J6UY01_THATH|nr:hypothetical protein FRX31_032908 [Thalictrum thalictroides]
MLRNELPTIRRRRMLFVRLIHLSSEHDDQVKEVDRYLSRSGRLGVNTLIYITTQGSSIPLLSRTSTVDASLKEAGQVRTKIYLLFSDPAIRRGG